MICIHCGKEIEAGSRFCGFCGCSQTPAFNQSLIKQTDESQASPQLTAEKEKGRKHGKRGIIAIAVAIGLVAAAAGILVAMGIIGGQKEKAREGEDLKNLLAAYAEATEKRLEGGNDTVTIRVHFEQTKPGWNTDTDNLPFVLSKDSKPTEGDYNVTFVFSDSEKTVAYIGHVPKGDDSAGSPAPTPHNSITYTACTADELISALQSNASNAGKAYTGKDVELSGYLKQVDSGGQFITIGNGHEETPVSIKCFIKTSEQRKEAADLEKGQYITVFGTITDVGETTGYTMNIDRFDTLIPDPAAPHGGDDPTAPGGDDPVEPPIDDPAVEEPPVDSKYDAFTVYGYSYREAIDQGWADEFEEIADQMNPEGTDTMSRFMAFIDGCDKKLFTRDDLEGFSKEMAMLARNAPFAHEGRKFDMEVIRTFFQKWKWYDGTIAPDAFEDSLLNGFEKANIDTVWAYEKEMGYQK